MSACLGIALSPLSRPASPATPVPYHSAEPQHNAATTTAMLGEVVELVRRIPSSNQGEHLDA